LVLDGRFFRVVIAVAVIFVSGHSALFADETSPEAVLKGHGLKRSGSAYILTSEADIQKKISEARLISRKLTLSVNQQQAFEHGTEGRQAFAQQLVQQSSVLNEQIREIDQQIDNLGAAGGGNNFAIVQHNQLVRDRNQFILTFNEVNNRLSMLRSQTGDTKWKQDVDAEVARGREAYIQAVLNLRELVDTTTRQYAEITKLDDVKQALASLGPKSKTTLKLGPSKEFLANVKLLEKVEKSVLTEEVELRRTHGVYEVDVTFNGKVTVPMVFDTGASLTTISSELAARIGLKPSPSDDTLELSVADGSVIKAKRMTIPSLRVGKFTVNDVECAVMPADKRDVPLLLGQSFHRYFTYKFTGASGRLVVSKVETADQPQAKPDRATKSESKGRRATRSKSTLRQPSPDGFGNMADPF
jgi:clan AA aspartic protease (TIGR02281 family)